MSNCRIVVTSSFSVSRSFAVLRMTSFVMKMYFSTQNNIDFNVSKQENTSKCHSELAKDLLALNDGYITTNTPINYCLKSIYSRKGHLWVTFSALFIFGIALCYISFVFLHLWHIRIKLFKGFRKMGLASKAAKGCCLCNIFSVIHHTLRFP